MSEGTVPGAVADAGDGGEDLEDIIKVVRDHHGQQIIDETHVRRQTK